jgi:hypothetical protein
MTNTLTSNTFDYKIVRAKRKTVAIHVHNGSVEVRAPLRVSQRWINEFVQSKSDWVLKRLNEKPQTSIVIADGAIIPYLGAPLTIHIAQASKKSILFNNNELMLNLKEPNEKNCKALFTEWIKKQASDYMVPHATALAQQLNLHHKLHGFRFRITRRTWGHCSSKGMIQFNPLIMLASPDVVDYLIAHEVCHLQHMNHSAQYWGLISTICKDYKLSQKSLKSLEPYLQLY